jgi:flagellar basal body-associated protein FliL
VAQEAVTVKFLPIIGAAVVALIIGGAAAWFLKPEPPKEVVAAPPVEGEHHEEQFEEHMIKDRIITLADPGAKRYLKLTLGLMVRDLTPKPVAAGGEIEFIAYSEPEATDGVDTAAPKPKVLVLPNILKVQDVITTTMGSKRVDELNNEIGRERTREELKGRINAVLPKEKQVTEVLFVDFVIQ